MLSSVVHASGIAPPFIAGGGSGSGSDPATDAAPNPLGLSGSPPLSISALSSPTGPQNQTLLSDWWLLVALGPPGQGASWEIRVRASFIKLFDSC